MSLRFRNLLLFVFPFILMIVVNQFIKPSIDPISNDGKWNTTKPLPDHCSWACHNSTNYCIEHHVKMNKLLLLISQPFYFGEITLLKMAGSYSLVNILILVTLVPLYLWYFLVRIIDVLIAIKEAKK